MLFYNFEAFFGKRKKIENDEEVKPMGPDTGSFDYGKWQWHLMVKKLIDELNLKPNEVYKMNYIDALNWLSLFHQRDKHIEQMNRQNRIN
jgi:hypothetical protein